MFYSAEPTYLNIAQDKVPTYRLAIVAQEINIFVTLLWE